MLRSPSLRRTVPVALLAAGALLLAGCGSDGSKDGKDSKDSKDSKDASSKASDTAKASGCDIKSGDASDAVKVTGEFGKTQTATFEKPLKADELQRTVVTKGDGATTADGDEVDTIVSAYLGGDGKSLGTQPLSLTVGDDQVIEAFSAGISCVPFGSRVVVTVPAKDMYGDQGNAQAGIKGTDTVVIVTDVIGKKKPLVPQAWTSDKPTVKFDASGKPTLTLPAGKPSPDLKLLVLEPGKGEVVKAGDQVTVDYQGTSWDTKKIFDQSYGKQPVPFRTTDVVAGFGSALVGQKVGTKLVVTIPPKYAYGEKGSGSELAGQTLVFVIEIKATQS
ncbi:FKBP-type peptidyl-prolyl cis-trans isomerase [Marmoricola sp. RAF53]|uniref:FKBP-type peptidyl-prolyl cis-trans isomerase n=1 Tax=Marmoricola sp. RAF53 TaxID=3233059 RepID=UPI003F95D392